MDLHWIMIGLFVIPISGTNRLGLEMWGSSFLGIEFSMARLVSAGFAFVVTNRRIKSK